MCTYVYYLGPLPPIIISVNARYGGLPYRIQEIQANWMPSQHDNNIVVGYDASIGLQNILQQRLQITKIYIRSIYVVYRLSCLNKEVVS